MRPSDRNIRIAGATILCVGLAACGVAILAEQLGLGAEAGQGTFGWKRFSLLVLGAVVLAAGAALMARPRIIPRPLNREGIRTHIRSLSERDVRIAGAVALLAGLALCGLALFAKQLEVAPLITPGALGWRQIGLLFVGGLMVTVGGLLLTRSQRTRMRIDILGLLFAVGVYGAVQLAHLKPPSLEGGDQLDYFNTADKLPDVTANHRHLRLGLLFPVRGAIEVFGYSEAAYYAVPLLAGLALAGFTYLLARMLFGWAVAVAAALLATLNPYVLWNSSHLLPDVPAAAALVGALAALVGAGILHLRSRVDRWTIALLIAGGFLLGWAYLTREYLLVAFPLALVVFFAYRIPWRRLGWVALGGAPPLILEAVWGAVNYGDPLVRFSTSATPQVGAREGVATQALDVLDRLPSLFLTRPGGWVFVALFFGVVLYGSFAAIRGDRRFLLPIAWTGGIWLVLTLSGVIPILLGGEHAFLKLEVFRYWLPIVPGLVIGGLAAVYALIRLLIRNDRLARPLGLASLAGITLVTLTVGISSISHSATFVRNGADQYLELRDFLREEGASYSSLYIDRGAGQSLSLVLPMYTRNALGSPIWKGDIRSLARDTEFLPVDEIEAGLVVVRAESIRWLAGSRDGFSPPRYLLDPPSEWQPVMISDNGEVIAYSVDEPGRPAPEYLVSGSDWHLVEENGSHPAADMRLENGRTVIEITGDDSALIFDGRGEDAGPPDPAGEALIDPDAAVWGRVQMTMEGAGSTSIRCFFYGDEDRKLDYAAVRGSYTQELESIDYRCRAPRTGGPFHLRVAVHVRGPVELTLGENTVYVARDRTRRLRVGG